MPYYQDMFGNLHYNEPAGTESEWLEKSPTGTLADMSLAQFKAADVTQDLLSALASAGQSVTLSGAGALATPAREVLEPSPAMETLPELEVGKMAIQPYDEYVQGGEGSQIGPAAVLPALAGLGLPGWLTGILGVAGAGYGIYQALGGGEGEGLFGMNLLGGDSTFVNGVELGGPGLAEPAAKYVLKEWHVNYSWGKLQYYLVQMPGSKTRKIAMYNSRTGRWKVWTWRTPHLAVIGKNMPSHRQLTRLKRNLARHTADAKTILKITQPAAYAKQLGYRKYKRTR